MHQRRLDTPIGPLWLYEEEATLIRIAFSPVPEWSNAPLGCELAAVQLHEYFSGQRQRFELPYALPGSGFAARAQRALSTIPFGQTRTYAELAALVGSPGASRAAGSACARNPLPIILPCHRIVLADGTPGQYAGGEEHKCWLLDFEASGAMAGDNLP